MKPLIGDQPSAEFANEPREERRPNGGNRNGRGGSGGQRNDGGRPAAGGGARAGAKPTVHGEARGGHSEGGTRPDAISRNRPGSKARKRIQGGE